MIYAIAATIPADVAVTIAAVTVVQTDAEVTF